MIKQEFLTSLQKYTADKDHQQGLWSEIERNYSKPDRHYHNLDHLESLTTELKIYKDRFSNWDTIVFAIAYHDLVYNTLKGDNEERTANLAIRRLTSVTFPEAQINACAQLIRATKKHEPADAETNLFTDADLSILGTDADRYHTYAKQIRKEYSIYPDILYNPGRKKVLLHFLKMEQIYKTKEFSDRYEHQARANMQAELKALTDGVA